MIIIKKSEDLRSYLKSASGEIGFVPTMGALHDGHMTLINQARKQSSTVVCSIFVNPTQFNDPKDFAKYPVTIEKDIELLEQAGTDILFLPGISDIYPDGTSGQEIYDLGFLETVFEGEFRPGHFQGVCQVMFRLLSIVSPHKLFMGQKDYQQCMVVSRLLELTGMSSNLVTCPTVREKDGLAMSSRNKRLSEKEREQAVGISKALYYGKAILKEGNLDWIVQEAKKILLSHAFRIDYLEFAHGKTLEPRRNWNGKEPLVLLVAAFQGDVRLIDNIVVHS